MNLLDKVAIFSMPIIALSLRDKTLRENTLGEDKKKGHPQ
jgi:hypothetical protein